MSMMEKHECWLACNSCPRQLPWVFDDHEDAEACGRREGWEKDGHSHRCPECSRAMDSLALGQLQGRWELVESREHGLWVAVCGGTRHSCLTPAQLLTVLEDQAEQVPVLVGVAR